MAAESRYCNDLGVPARVPAVCPRAVELLIESLARDPCGASVRQSHDGSNDRVFDRVVEERRGVHLKDRVILSTGEGLVNLHVGTAIRHEGGEVAVIKPRSDVLTGHGEGGRWIEVGTETCKLAALPIARDGLPGAIAKGSTHDTNLAALPDDPRVGYDASRRRIRVSRRGYPPAHQRGQGEAKCEVSAPSNSLYDPSPLQEVATNRI
jgi:hypothetical protein